MFILAFLICTVSSLLTFTDVQIGMTEYDLPALIFTLLDESFNEVSVEKNILIQPSPLFSFYTTPTTKFTGSGGIFIIPSVALTFSFTISCTGCEIYQSGSFPNDYYEDEFFEVTPSATTLSVKQAVSIFYYDYYETPFSNIYMVTQEDFDFSVVIDTPGSGTATVTFFSDGLKCLLFYFDDSEYTDIGQVLITVEQLSYSVLTFTTNIVLFIESPLGFVFKTYSDSQMTVPLTVSCDLALSLLPSASITGTITKTLSEGSATFSNLYINTPGSYNLKLIGTCIDSFQSEEIVTITGVDSIKIITASPYIKLNQEIEITVDLSGISNTDFPLEALVTLESSTIEMVGETSKLTSTGEALFLITFEIIGETTLSAYTDLDLSTVDSVPLDIFILESMCLESENDLCITCVPLASPVDGVCVCNDLSVEVDIHCECIDGYVQSGNECVVPCFNNFNNSDVEGYYNEDYKSISIKFESGVVESSESSCTSRITLPDYLNYLLKECKWTSSTIMKLTFKSVLNGNDYFIELDPSLTPAEEKCNGEILHLNLTVPKIELPVPSISLDGPSTEHILCGNKNITVSSTYDPYYSYEWTAIPFNSELYALLNSTNSDEVVIPIIYTQLGDLNVTCKVVSSIYNTSATDSIIIVITDGNFLTVNFNTPKKLVVTRSDRLFIKGFIGNICGDNTVNDSTTYKWNDLSTSTLNFDLILSNSQDPSSLLIFPNTLEANKEYSFELNITVGSSTTGSSKINIQVKPSDLLITFSKNSGTISKTQDLNVKASVVDPDSTSTEILYEWSCLEGNRSCENNNKGILEFKNNTDTLIVLKESLKDGALYLFNLSASTGDRETVQNIEFYIDGKAQGELDIQYTNDDMSEYLIFNGIATGMNEPKYSWSIKPSISVIETKYSFLSIPRKYLNLGIDYNISLTAIPSSGNPLMSYVIIHQPTIPSCPTPDILFITTKWQITVGPCASESFSLTYEFGCFAYSNLILWFTDQMLDNSANILIPHVCNNIFAKVCNGPSCVIVSNDIPSGNKLHGDIITDFNNDFVNDIYIPNVILYYLYILTTQDQLSQVISKFDTFFKSPNPNNMLGNTFTSCLNSTMLKPDLIISESADTIYKLVEYIISTYKSSLTSSQMLVITTCLGKLTNFLDFYNLTQMIKELIGLYFETALPGYEPLIQYSDISVYAIRALTESLPNQNMIVGKSSLEVPKNIQLGANTIIDTEYIIYPSVNAEIQFEVSFYTSGTYIDSKLEISQPQSTQLSSGTVYATVSGNFTSSNNYECAYLESNGTWMRSGCKITESENGKVKMGLEHQSTFKVYEINLSGSCGIGAGPLITACTWALIAIFGVITFYIIDKNQEEEYKTANKYATYAFTSICIRQASGRRVSSIIYLFSIHIIFIFLIGLILLASGKPQESSNKEYGVFSGKNIIPGIVGWIITQILAIPINYYIFNKYASKKKELIAKYTALIISIFGFIGIIAMTVVFCKEFSFYWVVNYFIFLPFQVIIEIPFAVIVWKRQKSCMASISDKVAPEIEELNQSKRLEDFNTFKKRSQSQASVIEKGPNSSVDISNIN